MTLFAKSTPTIVLSIEDSFNILCGNNDITLHANEGVEGVQLSDWHTISFMIL